MDAIQAEGLGGLRVVSFESRRAREMAELIRRYGGEPVIAPSMREVPLSENSAALDFVRRLEAGEIGVVIFLTGVGTRTLIEAVAGQYPREKLAAALGRTVTVARGPKPQAALKDLGLQPAITIPEPNTWREVLSTLDLKTELHGKTIAVQEYGVTNREFLSGLEQRGANVLRVAVYRWALPEDTKPLKAAVREIVSGNVAIAVFTNATQVDHLFRFAAEEGLEADHLRKALGRMVIASIGPVCSEALEHYDLRVDVEPEHPKMGHLVASLARRAETLVKDKRQARSEVETGQLARTIAAKKHAFLAACSLERAAYTPVWFMRQAGRYMKEYRALREKFGFLELCKRPDLSTEIAVVAVEKLKVDAAILFSDILLVLEPLGVGLEYSKGDGPVIHRPIRTSGDVESLPEVSVEEALGFVFDAVRQTRAALNEKVPLIGFSGAPFTLASYLIEGGGSHGFVRTKRFIHSNPEAWHRLMERLSRLLVTYLNGQVAAGAQALQVFDSWLGCLGPEDYRTYVLPHMRALIAGIQGIPVIHFSTGTAGILKLIRSAGGSVIGLDWRVDLDAGWEQVGYDVGVQGNLDPVILFAPLTEIRRQAQQILRRTAGRPGHIFNLGHGVLPETPVENVVALVDIVHDLSSK